MLFVSHCTGWFLVRILPDASYDTFFPYYRFDPGNQEALRFLNEDDVISLAKSAYPLVSVVLHRLVQYHNAHFRDSLRG